MGGAALAPVIVCSMTLSGVETRLDWYTLVARSSSLRLVLSIISMTVLSNGDGGVPSLLASPSPSLNLWSSGWLELCSAWERKANGSGLCPSPCRMAEIAPSLSRLAPRSSWRTASSEMEGTNFVGGRHLWSCEVAEETRSIDTQ